VSTLTFILTRFFDLLLAPFGDHRTAGLVALSVLMGACLTLLYRATSDARRIRRSRDIFKARGRGIAPHYGQAIKEATR
jgi:hypothetical protein